ncbi:MAG: hypothetical protein V1926_03445 [Candidatus Peregrinibacteria bacterium]
MKTRDELRDKDAEERAERARLRAQIAQFKAFLDSAAVDVGAGSADAISGQCYSTERFEGTAAEMRGRLERSLRNYTDAGGKKFSL